MRLIGLSGYAQSGKDTVGRILVEEHGFTRVSFADKLREVALAADPYVRLKVGVDSHGEDFYTHERLSFVVQTFGWDVAKTHEDVRRLLQKLGTEAGRNILGENVWVEAALRPLENPTHDLGKAADLLGARYVITDVRFPNEWRAIKDRGGQVWRISRPGFEPVNGHPSETALDGYEFDVAIQNKDSIDTLVQKVAALVSVSVDKGA